LIDRRLAQSDQGSILEGLRDRYGLEQPGGRNCVAAALANAMFHHRGEYGLHVLGYDRIAAVN
jgi:hypothetical protein